MPQICLHHRRIGTDLFRRPFCQHGPVIEHENVVRHPPDQMHVMFHQDHRYPILGDALDEFVHALGLGGIEPSCRLIQQ